MSVQSSRDVGSLLRALRENAGLTQDALARASRCSKAHLSLVESGQRRLSIERAAAIEAALDIHDGRLQAALNWQRVPETIRAQIELSRTRSADMTRRLRSALGSEDPLASLRAMIERDAASESVESARDRSPVAFERERAGWQNDVAAEEVDVERRGGAGRPIPIINKVAAGYPREFTDLGYPRSIADEYLACPPPGVSDPDAFAARVVGDSMEPEYVEGDVVVFSPEAKLTMDAARNGPGGRRWGAGDCFVRLERDAETTFKRVYFEEGGRRLRLQPLNSAYPPRIVDREEVAGLYAAVYVLRKVKREGKKN